VGAVEAERPLEKGEEVGALGDLLARRLAGAGPVLLRVETSAGHGAGKPTSKQIAERADFLAFLEGALGLNGSHLHCGKVDEEVAG
jgi:hypothetical protein